MQLRLSEPSFKSLYVEVRAFEKRIATATAFVAGLAVGESFLVTNRHVVTGRDQHTGQPLDTKNGAVPTSLGVWHNSDLGMGHFVEVDVPLFENGVPMWIEHPVYGANADLVAIRLPSERPDIFIRKYGALPHTHLSIEPAQMVSVVGFPFGERTGRSFAVWATGFVATEPDIDHGNVPTFLIDCRSRKGQSGSPVILHHGYHAKAANAIGFQPSSELLGIYSGRINEDSDLGVVWKALLIVELLMYANSLPAM